MVPLLIARQVAEPSEIEAPEGEDSTRLPNGFSRRYMRYTATSPNTVALHIVLGIYCTSHYIYTKIQAKFLSNQDERAPLVASEAIRVPLGHFASY